MAHCTFHSDLLRWVGPITGSRELRLEAKAELSAVSFADLAFVGMSKKVRIFKAPLCPKG